MTSGLSSDDRRRLERLFDQAAELPPAERAAFVERECGAHDALRAELERLLAGLAGEDVLGKLRAEPPARVGTRIGPYELLEKIGEGGMGEVYVARQLEPVVRHVALKLVRAGMDSRQLVARFEAERQALAMMDHPAIAKVLDAGSTDAGQPYFVMEYIEGVPIPEFCTAHDLDTSARLRLFVSVCRAIQHAHQKGIIHRDIKPSNVLVAMHDGRPAPKVIDFGIAKAIHPDTSTDAPLTRHLQLVGTPAYMSPEQAGTTGQDIDTRSDVYSLGVLLYELLTGTTPFDARQLSEANLAEMVRLICEETPHKPSTRVSTVGDGSHRVGRTQRDGGRRRSHDLRGDLDWIVMKCLEKDRARRYETANGLAEDIERHLRDEPVTAGPPSTAYRLRKFVRRNRAGVAAAAAVAAVLVLGAVGTTWGLLRALDEKARADLAATRATRAAADEAKARADESQRAAELRQVAEFQSAQLGELDPMTMGVRLRRALLAEVPEERREEVDRSLYGVNFTNLALGTLEHDLLRPSLAAIEARFEEQPRVQAQLLGAVASTAHALAVPGLGMEAAARSRELLTQELGADDPRTLDATNGVGVMLSADGKHAEAEPYIRDAVAGLRRTRGAEDLVTLNAVDCLADVLRERGKLAEAEVLFRDVLKVRRRTLGDDHRDTLESTRVLGAVLREQGRFPEAERHLRDALEAERRLLGDDDPVTLSTINSLSVLLAAQKRYEEAEPLDREALAGKRRVYGDDHPRTLTSITNLSQTLQSLGRLAEAEPLCREALEGRRRTLGDAHPGTLLSVVDLGVLLLHQGHLAEAEPLLREALEGQRRVLGDDHSETITSINNLGLVLRGLGRLSEAEPYLREAIERQRRQHPDGHPNLAISIGALAGLLRMQGKLDEAEPYYHEAFDELRRLLGEDNPATLSAMNNLAMMLQQRGKLDEAEALFRRSLDGLRRVYGDGHQYTLETIGNLGALMMKRGRLPEAETLLVEALEGSRLSLGDAHPSTLSALNNMGSLRREQGRFAEAGTAYLESLEGLRREYGDDHPYTLRTICNVGQNLQSQGRHGEAAPHLVEALDGQRRVLGAEHPDTVKTAGLLQDAYTATGESAHALELLREFGEPEEGAEDDH